MTREWKPSKPCMDCISYEYESADEGRCVVAEHVALPPWTDGKRRNWTVQWNDSCELFESDQVEVKP
jgi:hypothetical protein